MLIDRDSGIAQFVTCWHSLSDLAKLNESQFFEAQVAKMASYFTTAPRVHIVDVCVFEEHGAVRTAAGLANPMTERGR